MPEPTATNQKVSRSFGISIGVTESIYLLGLVLLAIGISLVLSPKWAFIVIGLLLIRTAERNAKERH